MENKIKKNYIYHLAYQILVMVFPLITTPYISRVLGVQNIGIYSYTLSIATYFTLFGTLGTALYGQRQIAFYQTDKHAYSIAFWEIFAIRCLGMVLSIAAYLFLFVRPDGEYSLYFLVLTFELAGSILDISWLYQGLERFQITVVRNSIIRLISIICIFCFIKTPEDFLFYFILYAASTLAGNLSLWLSLPRTLARVHIREIKPFGHLLPTIRLFIPQIAIQVYTILDKTMLGYLIYDKSEVGYYDQGQKIIRTLLTVVTALGTVMLPNIANKFSEGDKEGIKTHIYRSFQIVCMLSVPMFLGISVVAASFVPLYFGEGYEKVILLIQVISPILFFIGISNVIGMQFLLPTKREKHYTISVISGSCVNCAANLILIPRWGALGASIGTILAELSVTAVQILFTMKDFNYQKIAKKNFHYLAAGIGMFIGCSIIQWLIGAGAICLCVQAAAGMLIYGILLVIMKDELILLFWAKLFRHNS